MLMPKPLRRRPDNDVHHQRARVHRARWLGGGNDDNIRSGTRGQADARIGEGRDDRVAAAYTTSGQKSGTRAPSFLEDLCDRGIISASRMLAAAIGFAA